MIYDYLNIQVKYNLIQIISKIFFKILKQPKFQYIRNQYEIFVILKVLNNHHYFF